MGYSWRIRSEGPWLGFAVSHDGGLTWTLCRGFPIFQSVSAIVEMPTGELLVGVRGPFVGPQNDGGVYRASSYLKVQDSTDWQRTLSGVAISSVVLDPVSSTLFASTVATPTAANVVITSQDRGLTWVNLSANAQLQLSGAPLFVPFYSTLTIVPGQTLFLLVLLAPSIWLDLGGLGGGNGQVFYLNLSNATASWQVVGGQPAFANPQNPNMDCVYDCKTTDRCCWTLDQDYSAKDYAAIMVDPRNSSILYVAANAGFLAYRVDWRRALNQGMCTYNSSSSNALTVCYNTSIDLYLWTPMWSQSGFVPDTIDNQVPHGDCRNFAWDTDSDSLLLLSDGGVSVRFKPESKGQGYWRGWSGDIGTMELVSVSYDAVSDRFVGAAQDNDCQLSVFGITTPGRNVLPTLSFNLGCDGAATAVAPATSTTPGRYYCSCYQMLGLAFVQYNATTNPSMPQQVVTVPLTARGFPGYGSSNPQVSMSVTPFFETPFRLNAANVNQLYFWANNSVYGSQAGPGVFRLDVSNPSGMGPNATLAMSTSEDILNLQVGGIIDGVLREDLIMAVSSRALYSQVGISRTVSLLPTPFAAPIAANNAKLQSFCQNAQAQAAGGPCTASQLNTWPNHRNSLYLAMDGRDAKHIVVTGWPDLESNTGQEHIYVTWDLGVTWCDAMDGLALASSTPAGSMIRPSGPAIVGDILLVGTATGVFGRRFSKTDCERGVNSVTAWVRLGQVMEFPYVAVASLSYDTSTDVLVVGTLGRGVYVLKQAASAIERVLPGAAPGSQANPNTALIVIIVFGGALILILLVFYYQSRRSSHTEISDNQRDSYRRFASSLKA